MKLRIGLVTSEFPPDLGGVETYAWQLAKVLGQRPHLDITVYAPAQSRSITAPEGVTIKPILKSCRQLDWSHLRQENIDVWHALSACHAWLAEKTPNVVVSVHGNDFLSPYPLTMRPGFRSHKLHGIQQFLIKHFRALWRARTRNMLRRTLSRVPAIISNSRYTATVLKQTFPECTRNIKLGWVGVDPVFFSNARSEPNPVPVLLTVCRLSEQRKNVDQVIRALAKLKNDYAFQYIVVGDGPLRPELESLAGSLGIADQVRFLGSVSDSKLLELYAQTDLFILTSAINPVSHEGFGIVYLEAAASGVPSIAAQLAGAAEAVSEGVSGHFIQTPDSDSIAEAISLFLSGKMQVGSASCRAFAQEFTWDRVADTVESAYREALPS